MIHKVIPFAVFGMKKNGGFAPKMGVLVELFSKCVNDFKGLCPRSPMSDFPGVHPRKILTTGSHLLIKLSRTLS